MTCVCQGSLVASDRKASSPWLSLKGNALAHLRGQSKDRQEWEEGLTKGKYDGWKKTTCTRVSTYQDTCVVSFLLTTTPWGGYYCLQLIDKEIKAWRG